MVNLYEERLAVEARRETLLDQMHERFGEIPEEAEIKVRTTGDDTQLKVLLRRVLAAETLVNMNLDEA